MDLICPRCNSNNVGWSYRLGRLPDEANIAIFCCYDCDYGMRFRHGAPQPSTS